jgi:hypothetical protein
MLAGRERCQNARRRHRELTYAVNPELQVQVDRISAEDEVEFQLLARPVRPCRVGAPNHRRQNSIATYFFLDPGAYFLLYTATSDGEQSISGRSVLGGINVKRTLFRATQGFV